MSQRCLKLSSQPVGAIERLEKVGPTRNILGANRSRRMAETAEEHRFIATGSPHATKDQPAPGQSATEGRKTPPAAQRVEYQIAQCSPVS